MKWYREECPVTGKREVYDYAHIQKGEETHGTPPDWYDWPFVRVVRRSDGWAAWVNFSDGSDRFLFGDRLLKNVKRLVERWWKVHQYWRFPCWVEDPDLMLYGTEHCCVRCVNLAGEWHCQYERDAAIKRLPLKFVDVYSLKTSIETWWREYHGSGS